LHAQSRRALSTNDTATHHWRGMKQVEKRKGCDNARSTPQAPALRQLDADIIRFVEALAIADARRDHLAAAKTALVPDDAATNHSSQTVASTNDPRSHLRPILD
jgi:hypothetical protein